MTVRRLRGGADAGSPATHTPHLFPFTGETTTTTPCYAMVNGRPPPDGGGYGGDKVERRREKPKRERDWN
ncbi:hypothetical protein Hanom_Chr06g00506441 [Helianthus anomalus]